MFIFIKLLFPLELKAICQNTFTDYRKEYFKCNLRMLDMEEIFIVMLDWCSCCKHKLQHQTDQGANPGCAVCWHRVFNCLLRCWTSSPSFIKQKERPLHKVAVSWMRMCMESTYHRTWHVTNAQNMRAGASRAPHLQIRKYWVNSFSGSSKNNNQY